MIGKGDPPAARTTINRGNESCRGGGSRLTACRIIALADIRSQLPENRQREGNSYIALCLLALQSGQSIYERETRDCPEVTTQQGRSNDRMGSPSSSMNS